MAFIGSAWAAADALREIEQQQINQLQQRLSELQNKQQLRQLREERKLNQNRQQSNQVERDLEQLRHQE